MLTFIAATLGFAAASAMATWALDDAGERRHRQSEAEARLLRDRVTLAVTKPGARPMARAWMGYVGRRV